jgi:hypothetical protein
MTPIDWNDSEPGFPDFLPPEKPTPKRLTASEAQERLSGILNAAGVYADISTSYAYIHFPDGARFSESQLNIRAEGYTNR